MSMIVSICTVTLLKSIDVTEDDGTEVHECHGFVHNVDVDEDVQGDVAYSEDELCEPCFDDEFSDPYLDDELWHPYFDDDFVMLIISFDCWEEVVLILIQESH